MGVNRQLFVRIWVLFLLWVLVGCGTLEVGFETPIAAEPGLATAVALPDTTPNEETAVVEKLTIAYVKGGNVWLWTPDDGHAPLTQERGVTAVLLSDDAQKIAFIRNDYLWVVDSNGRNERPLIASNEFTAIAPQAVNATFHQMVWVPGTHTLLFNTRLQYEVPDLFANDDLWAINIDSQIVSPLLHAGDGGNFTVAPDGQHVAISRPGIIEIFDLTTREKRTIFTYTPVLTYQEAPYYARPAWLPDGRSLYVAIPPADGMAAPNQPTTIWHLMLEGNQGRLIGNIPAAFAFRSAPLFSADMSRVAYLVGNVPEALDIAVSSLSDDAVGEMKLYTEEAQTLNSLSPDGQHFAYTPPYSGWPNRQIGALDQPPLRLAEDEMAVLDIIWTDNTRYLYLRQSELGWDILLGELENNSPQLIDTITGHLPDLDFVASGE